MPKASPASDDGPLLELFDVLGQRWTLRVLWELRTGPLTYRDIAGRINGLSTSVLTERLRDLRAADLVGHEQGGYRLTDRGSELIRHVQSLRKWAQQSGFTSGR